MTNRDRRNGWVWQTCYLACGCVGVSGSLPLDVADLTAVLTKIWARFGARYSSELDSHSARLSAIATSMVTAVPGSLERPPRFAHVCATFLEGHARATEGKNAWYSELCGGCGACERARG